MSSGFLLSCPVSITESKGLKSLSLHNLAASLDVVYVVSFFVYFVLKLKFMKLKILSQIIAESEWLI